MGFYQHVLVEQVNMLTYRRVLHLPKPKVLLALIILCLSLTLLDIAMVETFYRPVCQTSEDWQIIWKWHAVYASLIVTLPLLTAIKQKSFIPLGTWLFFIFGLEDTLFYALQGYLPQQYPGIQILGIWEPLMSQVLPINLLGVILIFSITLGNWKPIFSGRFSLLDGWVGKIENFALKKAER